MTTAVLPTEQRFRLSDVSWEAYDTFTDLLGERHVRITFDRGELELMTVSPEHEHYKSLLARLVEALTEEGEDFAVLEIIGKFRGHLENSV